MRFRFIGDPNDNFSGPDTVTVFGLVFSRVEWTEVSDETVTRKLCRHNHFEAEETIPVVREVVAVISGPFEPVKRKPGRPPKGSERTY